MPAWPGGPCPNCGEHVLEKVIHCVSCRTLLNPDLDSPDVDLPVFEPLKELKSPIEFSPTSYTFACPHCARKLHALASNRGRRGTCKSCNGRIEVELSKVEVSSFNGICPHCDVSLQNPGKYAGRVVACKSCDAQISRLHLAKVRSTSR